MTKVYRSRFLYTALATLISIAGAQSAIAAATNDCEIEYAGDYSYKVFEHGVHTDSSSDEASSPYFTSYRLVPVMKSENRPFIIFKVPAAGADRRADLLQSALTMDLPVSIYGKATSCKAKNKYNEVVYHVDGNAPWNVFIKQN